MHRIHKIAGIHRPLTCLHLAQIILCPATTVLGATPSRRQSPTKELLCREPQQLRMLGAAPCQLSVPQPVPHSLTCSAHGVMAWARPRPRLLSGVCRVSLGNAPQAARSVAVASRGCSAHSEQESGEGRISSCSGLALPLAGGRGSPRTTPLSLFHCLKDRMRKEGAHCSQM